jgi:hypothetical protein
LDLEGRHLRAPGAEKAHDLAGGFREGVAPPPGAKPAGQLLLLPEVYCHSAGSSGSDSEGGEQEEGEGELVEAVVAGLLRRRAGVESAGGVDHSHAAGAAAEAFLQIGEGGWCGELGEGLGVRSMTAPEALQGGPAAAGGKPAPFASRKALLLLGEGNGGGREAAGGEGLIAAYVPAGY